MMIGEFRESIDKVSEMYEKEKKTQIDALNSFVEDQALQLDAWDNDELAKQQVIIKDCQNDSKLHFS